MSKKLKKRDLKPFLFVAVFAVWFAALWLIISDFFPNLAQLLPDEALKRTALLGDTFGSVSALMAAFAAVGAILALSEQRASVRRQMFVATFVGMMERLQNTVQDTDYVIVEQKQQGDLVEEKLEVAMSGQGAFYEISQELRVLLEDNFIDGMCKEAQEGLIILLYPAFYDDYKNDLGHFFRQLYHIIRFIDDAKDDERERFVKIVRASLSNSQLLLLAYNLVAGEGRVKFAYYVEKYSLLHNLGFEKDALGKAEERLIRKRLGDGALVSPTQQSDRLHRDFIQKDMANSQAKEVLKRFLIENQLNTDFGITWKNPS